MQVQTGRLTNLDTIPYSILKAREGLAKWLK
jgi:hypothetical protein